jgi:hypothetical protein
MSYWRLMNVLIRPLRSLCAQATEGSGREKNILFPANRNIEIQQVINT